MRGIVACVLLAACAPGEARMFVGLPPHEGAQSIIVALESKNGVDVYARPIDSPIFDVPLGAESSVVLHALVYEETLDVLQIPEGKVIAAQPTDTRARELPDAMNMFSATIDLANPSASWAPTTMRSHALAGYRLPAKVTPCGEFDISVYELDTQYHGSFVLPIDDQTVLASTRDGKFWRVSSGGAVSQVMPENGYAPYNAALGLVGGNVWLGGPNGAVYETVLDGDRLLNVAFAFMPGAQNIHWMSGTATDMFLLTVEGGLNHYDGVQFTHLHDFNFGMDLDWKGGVARVGAGEAVAVFPLDTSIVRVKGGVAAEELTPPSGALHAVADVRGIGTFVGDSEGQVLRFTGGEWEHMEDSKLDVWMLSMTAYQDGVIFGAAFGNVGQYIDGYGFCEPFMPVAFSVRFLTVIGRGRDVVLFGENPNTEKTPIAFMRRLN